MANIGKSLADFVRAAGDDGGKPQAVDLCDQRRMEHASGTTESDQRYVHRLHGTTPRCPSWPDRSPTAPVYHRKGRHAIGRKRSRGHGTGLSNGNRKNHDSSRVQVHPLSPVLSWSPTLAAILNPAAGRRRTSSETE
jgi:hypothetical protein